MAERRFGLLVASYDHADAGLSRLAAPRHDVEALARVLGDPAVGGFEVQTVVNQPSYQVAREVEAFFGDRRPDDLLLFYFSGHGLKDEQGRLYFAMTNTERRLLGATALAASFVNEMIEQTRSRRNVMLLDCCYSGAFATERSKGDPAIHTSERFSGRGRTVLTASDSMQYAYEGDRLVGGTPHSVFTRLIVDGLSTGDADRNRDGVVDLDELYEYVDDRIRSEEAQQRPSKWQWDVQGSVVIAQSVRGAGVPEDLRRAAASPFAGVRLAAVAEIAGLAEQQAAVELLRVLAGDADSRVASAAGRVLDGEPAAVDDEPKVSDPRANVAPPSNGRGRSVEARTAPENGAAAIAEPTFTEPAQTGSIWRYIPRSRPLRLVSIAAVLLILALAATWIVIAATSDVVIAVGSRPASITTGFNSTWVANQGSNSISRIDRSSHKVTATITVPAAPISVVTDDKAVWVATTDGSVTRIDPASNKITNSQPGDAATLATGNGVVYLGGSANPTSNREVVKYLDPADFLIHDIKEDVVSGHLAAAGSVLWLTGPGGPIGRLVVNPNYGELSTIPATNAGGLIAAFGSSVWYDCDNNRTLCNLVGESPTPAPTLVLGADIRAIATDGTEVWLATANPAQLVQINVATRKVTKHAQSGSPAGVALTKDAVWLTDASSAGRVVRVAR